MDKKILESARHCVYEGDCSGCPLGGEDTCWTDFANAIDDHFEQYRWHDLQEDPNDLPPIDLSECLVRELWEDGDITYDVVYVQYVLDYAGTGVEPNIIAWKEIEP